MIKRRFLVALSTLLFLICGAGNSGLQAQSENSIAIGTWTAYSSHLQAKAGAIQGNKIWVATDGGIFSYHFALLEHQTYSTVDGLSNLDATAMYHDTATGNVFVGYEDGSINYFEEAEDISVISDIERSDAFTSKRINRFQSYGDFLYIATNFGVVIYDLDKNETRSSVTKIGENLTGSIVEDIALVDDTLWAAMGSSGLYKVSLNHPNITDPTAWIKESDSTSLPDGKMNFVTFAGSDIYTHVDDTIYRKVNGVWEMAPMTHVQPVYMHAENDIVNVTARYHIEVLYPGDSLVFGNNGGTPNFAIGTPSQIWLGSTTAGLQRLKKGDFLRLNPEGPKNNLSEHIIVGPNDFYIIPYTHTGAHAVSGVDGVYYYSYEDGWDNLSLRNGDLDSNMFQGFANGYLDPATDTAYIVSKGRGLMLFYHGDTVRSYNNLNSSMQNPIGVGDDDIRANDVTLDPQGNIWVTTITAEGGQVLSVIAKDGTHNAFAVSGTRPLAILVDDFGQKWIVNDGGGVSVYDENGTFLDPTDDQQRRLTSAVGNGDLPTVNVFSMVKDKNGHIWVGTNDGVTVFYDPFSILTDFASDASCPVFEFQCLMKFQRVQAMAVDGANRKWIATDQGAFLISEDGTEQIYHFTTDNSPLYSNNIKDIAINPRTGEVFFATDKGMLSFMGEAIEGKTNCDDLYAFPNPVLSSYGGDITIRGMPEESVCKITTASGMMIREIESLGGQAIWDGLDQWGNRAKTGVYIAMIANKDGEGACYTKIAIVNDN